MNGTEENTELTGLMKALKRAESSDAKFEGFVKGWYASIQPDKMPEGSLRVCKDLCFSEYGALSVPLEPLEVIGQTASFYRTFFIVEAGGASYFYRHVDNDGTDDKLQYLSYLTTINLTGYDEIDIPAKVTVAANLITVASLDTDEDIYVSDDYTAAYFDGDFEHHVGFNCTISTDGICGIWALSNSDPSIDGYGLFDLMDNDEDHLSLRVVDGAGLVTNGSMEIDDNWSDWGTVAINMRSNEQAHSGTYSRKFVIDGQSEGILSDDFTTVTSTGYTISLWVYPVDLTSIRVVIRKGDDSGIGHAEDFGGLTPNTWNNVSFAYTETAGGSQAWIGVLSPAPLTSGTWYIDDVATKLVELVLQETNGAVDTTDTSIGLSTGINHYVKIKRDETVGDYGELSCEIYDDADMTSHLDTISILLTEKKDFQFRHAMISYDGASGGNVWSGTIFDVREVGGSAFSDVVTLTSNTWEGLSYVTCQNDISTSFYTYIACSSAMKKLLAGTASPIGCTVPAAAPGVAVQGVGLTGTYKYVYTYYENATGDESDYSAAATIALSNEGCRVTYNTGGGGSNADFVKIYRTIAGGGSYYHVKTIAKATGTWDDVLVDASLGVYLDDKAVGAPPSGASVVGSYLGRCWYLGYAVGGTTSTNKMYYSRRLYPGTVPVDYYVVVGNSEITLTGFMPVFGRAIVFNRDTILSLDGTTPDTFEAVETGVRIGTEATGSIASDGRGVYFVAIDGVYVYKETGIERISDQIDWVFNNIGDSVVDTLYKPYISRCRGTIWRNQYWLLIWIGSTARLLLVYDIDKKIWRVRSADIYCLFTDKANDRLLTGVKDGVGDYRLHSLEDSTDGITGTFSPEMRSREVDLRSLDFLERYQIDAKGTWTLTVYVDDVSEYEVALSGLTRNDINDIKSITSMSAGRRVSIKLIPTSPRPLTTKFYGLEFLEKEK